MKISYVAASAAALLLGGCQTFCETKPAVPMPNPPAVVSPAAAPVVARVPAQQQTLWLEDVVNTQSPLPMDAIRSQGDFLAVEWNADAVELLTQLARQRGLRFTWTGVRLPLPVHLKVNSITYENLLRLVELQTAWRATLTQLPGQLNLAFAQATPSKKVGGRL